MSGAEPQELREIGDALNYIAIDIGNVVTVLQRKSQLRREERLQITRLEQWRGWIFDAAKELAALAAGAAAPKEPPLVAYMNAPDRRSRSAAWLRLYAEKVRNGTAQSFDIPNTLAQTIEDIATFIETTGAAAPQQQKDDAQLIGCVNDLELFALDRAGLSESQRAGIRLMAIALRERLATPSPAREWQFTDEQCKRARRILGEVLPEYRTRDQVIDNLYYMDPNNDMTRLPSIAAALCVLGLLPSVPSQEEKTR